MLKILTSFLLDREQGVTINGQTSEWVDIEAGVPQGSILGPLLFLVYINDLAMTKSEIRIFADDTFIFHVVNENSTFIMNNDLGKISDWTYQ